MSKVLQERGFGSLPNSAETNLRDHVKSILTTVEADTSPIRRDDTGSYGPQYLDAYSCGATCLNDSLPRKEKDRGIIFMDTAYGRRWILCIGNSEYAFSYEDLVLIRRISFPGYGVLVRIEWRLDESQVDTWHMAAIKGFGIRCKGQISVQGSERGQHKVSIPEASRWTGGMI
ncbi:hypothetical protein Tco_0138754 [Tanacetum coccineum]